MQAVAKGPRIVGRDADRVMLFERNLAGELQTDGGIVTAFAQRTPQGEHLFGCDHALA